MCGIFSFISRYTIDQTKLEQISKEGMKCKARGPDNTVTRIINNSMFMMFHRLKINDITDTGNQPIVHPDDFNLILICNGEIYNFNEISSKYDFQLKSKSDCEIIVHLYKRFGIEKTLVQLDGVFAFVLIDLTRSVIYAARDPIGVRSMYIGINEIDIGFSSELKCLDSLFSNVKQFPPGQYLSIKHTSKVTTYNSNIIDDLEYKSYYNYIYPPLHFDTVDEILISIREKLTDSIKKRMISDRPIGCLLSGGLDSSLITAIVAKLYSPKSLPTFSIGLEGAVDLKYARLVSEHLHTDHHEYIITPNVMLSAIAETIQNIESYDITTIRASTPMYLLSKYISETSDIKVLFSGEGSDEASGSYMYFHNAPDESSFQDEIIRLMKDLHYFDVLRCDKSTASVGLEVRVPFLDKGFLESYIGIDPKHKIPKPDRIEKYLLRKAFEYKDEHGKDLLPDEVLWRMKEGMSDGVSSQEKGWFQIIQEHVETIISDAELDEAKLIYKHNPPQSKEALFYRQIYTNLFIQDRGEATPYYWLPKWSGNTSEPSARTLDIYDTEKGK